MTRIYFGRELPITSEKLSTSTNQRMILIWEIYGEFHCWLQLNNIFKMKSEEKVEKPLLCLNTFQFAIIIIVFEN